MNWIAIDLKQLERYGVAFRGDWKQLLRSREWLKQHRTSHSVRSIQDGILVLERNGFRNADLEQKLTRELERPLPPDPRQKRDESK